MNVERALGIPDFSFKHLLVPGSHDAKGGNRKRHCHDCDS
jgi:hypothetical protein